MQSSFVIYRDMTSSVDDSLTVVSYQHPRRIYEELVKPHEAHFSLIMMLTVFELKPELRDSFWFVRDMDEPAPTNPVLDDHSRKVFTQISNTLMKFLDEGNAKEAEQAELEMKALGARHGLQHGSQEEDFKIFRISFLKVMKKATGKRWEGVVEAAWTQAYDRLDHMVKAGLSRPSSQNVII